MQTDIRTLLLEGPGKRAVDQRQAVGAVEGAFNPPSCGLIGDCWLRRRCGHQDLDVEPIAQEPRKPVQ